VAAQEYYVGSAGEDWDTEPNCKNPANSTCSLRYAVFYAAQYSTQHGSPATVYVPEGEFFLSVVNPINLAGSVIIKGAGPDRTFIDGRGAARSFSIFEAPDPRWDAEVHARIQDLTLRNGHTRVGGGGAVRWTPRNPASTLELVNVVITDNHAPVGGGLWLAGGRVLIEDSVIENNTAWSESDAKGGGILIDESSAHIRSEVTIRNTIIRNNKAQSAASKGGGIAVTRPSVGGTLVIEDSVIRDNKAETGGGMYLDDVGRPVILRSVIEDNEATWRGGGIWTQHGIDILQSLIHGNVAGEDGGGAYMLKGGLIVNSTVDGNIAGRYGAGLRVADNLYIRNVTVTNNYTSSPSTDMEAAAGVSIFWAGVEIFNSIIAHNYRSPGPGEGSEP